MKNQLRSKKVSNKGITLIALVITIIVLLILAGVSIATLVGENGILTQAQDSKIVEEEAQIAEELKLAYNAMQIEARVAGWEIDKQAEEMEKELQRQSSSATVTVEGTNLKIEYKGYETTISAEGKINDLAKSNIVISKFEVSGTEVKQITPPTGFVHVGGTIEEGYVISDNSADAGKGVDSTELQGNQFVWVPVEKNQKVRINVSSEEEIQSIVVIDPLGDEIVNETNVGTSYSNEEIEPTINGYYNIEVTTASKTKEQMIDVKSLYAIRMWEIDTYTSEEYAKLNGYNSALELVNNRFSSWGTFSSIEQAIGTLQMAYKNGINAETETIDHLTKVNNNGGFYIGRYEGTYEKVGEVEKVASKKATVESDFSGPTKNGMLWNNISQIDALAKAKEYNTSLSSTLPTGAAWDRAMCWLIETGEKTLNEVTINSTSWGNYSNDTLFTGGLMKPGQLEETEANNIYDLAGNVAEWTTEANQSTRRVNRGGHYNSGGIGSPASNRDNDTPSNSYIYFGLRLTLFL